MTIKFVVAHRKDQNNVGDIASNPLQYFLKPNEYQTIDIANLGQESFPENVPMIVGGGGLINNDFIGNDVFGRVLDSPDKLQLEEMWSRSWTLSNLEYQELYQNFNENYNNLISSTINQLKIPTAPKFAWGIGQNSSNNIDAKYETLKIPKPLSRFNLVGLRDFSPQSSFNWVPCASCMHPALRKNYEIKNDVIWFEHKKQLIKDFGTDAIPRFINSGNNVEQTIELLGSSNIILTNSYHGAYWGTLLKKRVIVVSSWSTKFNFMKHRPAFMDKKESWRDAVERSQIFHDALDECVSVTEKFWNQIKIRL